MKRDVRWGAHGEDGESRAWIEPWAHSADCTWNLVIMLVLEGMDVKRKHLVLIHMVSNVEF